VTLAAERFCGVHVLADDHPRWKRDPVAQARAACAGGAAVVQLRAKHATDREVLAWAREIRALTRAAGTAFVVNDRFDLALLCEADGVHLGQEDVPPGRVPSDVRARLALGRSTHTPEQARAASDEPVAYVAFGPVFGTTSKASPYAARGLEALADVARELSPRPVVAIGGIDAASAGEAARAGARGVAVISAVAAADDPEAATRALVRALEAPRVR
jgi:thiamine-phosphate pyrophosphorylase